MYEKIARVLYVLPEFFLDINAIVSYNGNMLMCLFVVSLILVVAPLMLVGIIFFCGATALVLAPLMFIGKVLLSRFHEKFN